MHFEVKLKTELKIFFYLRMALIIINLMIPLAYVLLTLSFYDKNISDIIPVWGDENWWWQQANAISVYGRPLGYWGYNGGVAKFGGFATWGAVATMPYGIFGMIFGWNYSTFVIANIFFRTIATLLFIFLTKLDNKGLGILCIINISQIICNAYLFICMQESIRSSFGLVAVGLLVWLYKNEKKIHKIHIIIAGVYLYIIGQAYLIWTGFFFPFFIICHRRINSKLKYLLVFLETGAVIFLSRKTLRLFSSPYHSKSSSYVYKIANNMSGLKDLLLSPDPPFFFKLFLFGAIAIALIIILFLMINKKKFIIQDRIIVLFSCMIPIVFMLGHIVFYNTTKWTLARGMAIGIMASAFLFTAVKNKFPSVVMAIWGVVCLIFFYTNNINNTFINDTRFKTSIWEERIASTKCLMNDMASELDDSFVSNPWNYTIATYFVSPNPVSLSIPAGYSENTMPDEKIRVDSKWIGIGKVKDRKKSDIYIREFLNRGYIVS